MQLNRGLRSTSSRLFLTGLCATLLIGMPAPARSEFPPEKFENLQVLPKDIETRQLLDAMKGMAQALGVRCWYCHVGQEGQDLSEFDFISDEKGAKQVAREMIKMVRTIREKTMPEVARIMREVEGHADANPRANCFTCHRGKPHPGE